MLCSRRPFVPAGGTDCRPDSIRAASRSAPFRWSSRLVPDGRRFAGEEGSCPESDRGPPPTESVRAETVCGPPTPPACRATHVARRPCRGIREPLRRDVIASMWGRLLLVFPALALYASETPRGQIVDDMKCAADSSQGYALYLPSNYSPERSWNLILAFDPRARGRTPVERYQAAAESYGYIVAGSNNSRNGSWEVSMAAIEAMSADVYARFRIDDKRIYTAGMSGGARVAMQVALGSGRIAGVIASSAGFPDSVPRKTVPFAVFGTAGTEDFNYLEMRLLDRSLTTPHRVAIFEGGHTWLSSELAAEAVEWMEIQAMKSGRRPRDAALIDKLFAKRMAQAAAQTNDKDTALALAALSSDFA